MRILLFVGKINVSNNQSYYHAIIKSFWINNGIKKTIKHVLVKFWYFIVLYYRSSDR